MEGKVIFSTADGSARLLVDNCQPVVFEKTSSLVNFCNECGIEVSMSECTNV